MGHKFHRPDSGTPPISLRLTQFVASLIAILLAAGCCSLLDTPGGNPRLVYAVAALSCSVAVFHLPYVFWHLHPRQRIVAYFAWFASGILTLTVMEEVGRVQEGTPPSPANAIHQQP